MKLSDFISQTLAEVSAGVLKAQSERANSWIAPGHVEGQPVWAPQLVEFDVAVTDATSGEAGISVLSVGKVGGSHSREQVGRVRFSIPVYFEGLGGPSA